MQNPSATYNPNNFKSPSSRYAGFAFAAAINVAAVWAILTGLNIHPSTFVPPVLQLHVIQQSDQTKTPTLPPPKPMMQKPVVVQNMVPEPKFVVEQQQQQQTIAATTQPQPTNPPQDSAAAGMADTHTTPPYPVDARNLSHQGTVTLALSIDATGAVTNAQVRISSGYPELDQTAVSWVVAHWRYKPAIQNGAAVASTSLAAVKFDLKNAH